MLSIPRRLSRFFAGAGRVERSDAVPDSGEDHDTTGSEYDLLARDLEWRRHPDESGRYLNVFIEQNNTCNLKCRMCGFSDARVAICRSSMTRDESFAATASGEMPRRRDIAPYGTTTFALANPALLLA